MSAGREVDRREKYLGQGYLALEISGDESDQMNKK